MKKDKEYIIQVCVDWGHKIQVADADSRLTLTIIPIVAQCSTVCSVHSGVLLTIVIVIAAFGRERRQGRGQKHRQDATLHTTILHCTVLHCAILHCTLTALYCTAHRVSSTVCVLHSTAMHSTVLHCTTLYCTTLHCTLQTMGGLSFQKRSFLKSCRFRVKV